MSRIVVGVVAAAASLIVGFEGYRSRGYADVVNVVTACYGHTEKGLLIGKDYSAYCADWLTSDVGKAMTQVQSCLTRQPTDNQLIAFTSFTFNVGGGAFCSSTLVKKFNAGENRQACDQLLRWDMANGVRWRGLTRRREAEHAVCIKDL
jgi:lysozyme